MKFFHVQSVDDVIVEIKERITPIQRVEKIKLEHGLNRVLAVDIEVRENLPNFARSTVDGYAVKSNDTYGASESTPSILQLIGEVKMGDSTNLDVHVGEAVYVPTGGMVPNGADGMVMVEYTEVINDIVQVFQQIGPKDNCIHIGDDIKSGETLLRKNHCLRPQDLSALAAIGVTEILVKAKVKVGYISTGDEIVPPSTNPLPIGAVRDSNAFAIRGVVEEFGGVFVYGGIVKDDEGVLHDRCKTLLNDVDFFILSGGSSVGTKDYSVRVLNNLGEPGVFTHGIAIKPGKPTIIGLAGEKPVLGLPGHPVSATVIFKVIGSQIIQALLGRNPGWSTITAKVTQNIPSASGRTDFVRVSLLKDHAEWIATPVFGKSALISTLVKSDGLAIVPSTLEGIREGQIATVILL